MASRLEFVLGALIVTSSVGAQELYLTASSMLVPDQDSQLYSLPENGNMNALKVVANIPYPNEDLGAYSGAVVCGDVYFAVWEQVFFAQGIFAVNISSGSLLFKNSTERLFHVLECSSEGLIGVASDVSNGAFSLESFDFSTMKTQTIGAFPTNVMFDASDACFTFSDDGSQLWSVMTGIDNGKSKAYVLTIMSTVSGEVIEQRNFPTRGVPYFALPGAVPGPVQGAILESNINNEYILHWAEFEVPVSESDPITVTPEKEVQSTLFASSQSHTLCGETLYGFFEVTSEDDLELPVAGGVSAFNKTDGAMLWTATLPTLKNRNWGALACA
jgi:hypothetical protein